MIPLATMQAQLDALRAAYASGIASASATATKMSPIAALKICARPSPRSKTNSTAVEASASRSSCDLTKDGKP